jgi:phage gp46-like protein
MAEASKEIGESSVVKIKSSQKLFTEDEVSRLTGICLDHLHTLARSKHLGFLARAAEAAGEQAEKWLFTNSDLMILTVLYTRCQH